VLPDSNRCLIRFSTPYFHYIYTYKTWWRTGASNPTDILGASEVTTPMQSRPANFLAPRLGVEPS